MRGRRRWSPKKLGFIVAATVLAVIVLQFLYPADRLLPNAYLNTLPLGPLTQQEAKDRLATTYKDFKRTVKTAEHEYPVTPNDIGVQLDIEKTVSGSLGYPVWQRLIPGSFVWRIFNPHSPAVVNVQGGALKSFAETAQQQNYKAPINAAIVFANELPSVQPEQDGVDYTTDIITSSLSQQFFGGDAPLVLQPKILRPEVSAGGAQDALHDTNKLLEARPSYTLGGEKSDMSKAQLITVLDYTAKDHKLEVSFTAAKVGNFLAQLRPYMYTVPTGTIELLDGSEVTTIYGDTNKGIDTTQAVLNFRKVLDHLGQSQAVDIPQLDLTVQLKTERDYSKSQLGLKALLDDIVASKKDDYAIAVQELGGRGWTANAGGDVKFTPASTYKLFVAYAVLKNIESGTWRWGDSFFGTSVEACFDTMIINSDNPCAEAFGERIGWKNIENQMSGLGLAHTSLTSNSGFISTANDELIFMAKLGKGEILSEASRNKLIDVMKRQVYRRGIPSGTDAPVADKVGFLFGLLHDAALVYAPHGTYALVILTDNSSWEGIADATRKIQDHLD